MTMFTKRCSHHGPWRWEFASGIKISVMLILLGCLFMPAKIFAQCSAGTCTAAGTIVIDGNPCDWNLANFQTFPIRAYQLDKFGNGVVDSQFTEGSKDFFEAHEFQRIIFRRLNVLYESLGYHKK